jgi:cation diffusion facilitator CzcD-associated flavoprotein CzcO
LVTSVTDSETIIVGAGPAGLACAAALRTRGHPSLILEKAETLAASWHRHYDLLHLHTHRRHSGLPGRPMPRSFPKYPSRLQVIEYLENYARDNETRITYGAAVTAIQRNGDWIVDSLAGRFEAMNVIVATGLSNVPVRPSWPGQQRFAGKLLHSSEFRNAADLRAERVLVVGFGNSAGDIALECAEAGLYVGLSVRGPVNIVPLEILGLPTASIAIAQQFFPHRFVDFVNAPILRLRFRDAAKLGLELARKGPLTTIKEKGQTPLINVGTIERIRSGDIHVFGGISDSDERQVRFADGRRDVFDAIVMATGYRPALREILPDVRQRFGDAAGPPRGQLQPNGDGLYFCGFDVVSTGLLRQIGKEAKEIAASICGGAELNLPKPTSSAAANQGF